MGGVGALVGLAGLAVVVLGVAVILADDPAHEVVVLLLVGAFHALQIRHVGAPRIKAGAGAVNAGLGVIARAGRPHGVDDRAVVGQHLVLHRLNGLAQGFPRRRGDLVHGGIDEGVGRRAVLFLVQQIGMDGHSLCLPRLLRRRGADEAADGPQLGVSDAHKAVHEVEGDVPAQTLALYVKVGHGDLIFGAEEPAQAVFLFHRDEGGVRAADGGRVGNLLLCKGCGHQRADQHRRQHQRRRPAGNLSEMFHVSVPPLVFSFHSAGPGPPPARAFCSQFNTPRPCGQGLELGFHRKNGKRFSANPVFTYK